MQPLFYLLFFQLILITGGNPIKVNNYNYYLFRVEDGTQFWKCTIVGCDGEGTSSLGLDFTLSKTHNHLPIKNIKQTASHQVKTLIRLLTTNMVQDGTGSATAGIVESLLSNDLKAETFEYFENNGYAELASFFPITLKAGGAEIRVDRNQWNLGFIFDEISKAVYRPDIGYFCFFGDAAGEVEIAVYKTPKQITFLLLNAIKYSKNLTVFTCK